MGSFFMSKSMACNLRKTRKLKSIYKTIKAKNIQIWSKEQQLFMKEEIKIYI